MVASVIQNRKVKRSLLNSSLNIRRIGENMSNFSKSLGKATTSTEELVEAVGDKTKFTNRLIRDDSKFFRRRIENKRRKNNEDMIEATSITGVFKRTGKIRTSSSKGFLGRILDFFGILFLGWGLKYLPAIIKGTGILLKNMSSFVLTMRDFMSGTFDILSGFGGTLVSISKALMSFNFDNLKTDLEDNLSKVTAGFGNLFDSVLKAFEFVQDPVMMGFDWIKTNLWKFGKVDGDVEEDVSGYNKGGLVNRKGKNKEQTPPVVTNKPSLSSIEPFQYNGGGSVKAKGTVGYDTVPAWLTSGEYVITNSVVNDLGKPFFDAINSMSYHPSIKDIDVTVDQRDKYRKFQQKLNREWNSRFKNFAGSVEDMMSNTSERSMNFDAVIDEFTEKLESSADDLMIIAESIKTSIEVINKKGDVVIPPVNRIKKVYVPLIDGEESSSSNQIISGGGDDLGDTIAPVVNIMKILQDLKYDQ